MSLAREARAAGIVDQGQISKLLTRLQRLGLVENRGGGAARGAPNAWTLTGRGRAVEGTLKHRGELVELDALPLPA